MTVGEALGSLRDAGRLRTPRDARGTVFEKIGTGRWRDCDGRATATTQNRYLHNQSISLRVMLVFALANEELDLHYVSDKSTLAIGKS
jgi:hypothetical protein